MTGMEADKLGGFRSCAGNRKLLKSINILRWLRESILSWEQAITKKQLENHKFKMGYQKNHTGLIYLKTLKL